MKAWSSFQSENVTFISLDVLPSSPLGIMEGWLEKGGHGGNSPTNQNQGFTTTEIKKTT